MIELPNTIRRIIAQLEMTEDTLGMTTSRVFKVGDDYYLKVMACGSDEPLARDASILEWLGKSLPVPQVVHFEEHDNHEYLLMTAIPGKPACDLNADPAEIAVAYGKALRQFHESLDVDNCPFDTRLDTTIEKARARVEAGLVDESDFDAERSGRTAEAVWAEILEKRPQRNEVLVVSHGDYCLPNVLFDNQLRLTGYIDIGRCGVSDVHQDLALGHRSMDHNFGRHMDTFLEAYGIQIDFTLLEYYKLLDEMF